MDQPLWLGQAWPHLGQTEIAGTRHNPAIQAFFKDAGHPNITRDETAWCAAFVGACLERTGLESTRSLMARSYLGWGTDAAQLENPIGAVAVLSRGTNPAFGHVGFLIGQSPAKLWLLGGNQSDSVTVAPFPRSRLIGMRWAGGPRNNPTLRPAKETFGAALIHVLEMEGGYTDDPVDPGGPTNKGITLAVFAAWRKTPLNPRTRPGLLADLKTIPDKDLHEIYRSRYWQPGSCAEFAPAIALMHFDAAVNHGVGTAIRMLQQAVRVDADGEVGPDTRAAVRKQPSSQTLSRYANIRRQRYRSLKHFWRFGRGWLRRVDTTLNRAQALLDSSTNNAPGAATDDDSNYHTRKNKMQETREQIGKDETKWWGNSVTIWGSFVTTAAIIIPMVAPLFGLQISADIVRQIGAETFSAIQAVVGLVGMVMTIFGRLRASQTLVLRSLNLRL